MKLSEKQYQDFKEHLESIETPTDKLTQIRQEAYLEFTKKKKRKRIVSIQLAVAAMIVIAFLTSIRLSPTFAQTIAKIPGFAPIVELIAQDKGLQEIVDNNYYEEINQSVTKNGITFTLVGIIADEYGMYLPYTLTSPNGKDIDFSNVTIKQQGKELEGAMSYHWGGENNLKDAEDLIMFASVNKIDYTHPNFELEIEMDKERMTFPFTMKKEILKTKTYDLNKQLTIDGQKLLVKEVSISPLRVGVTIKTDPNNSMEILNINKIQFTDESGEKWEPIQNGVIGFGNFREEGEQTLFFQSNYFKKPKKLTLTLDKIEAMPKGEDYIEIDFSSKKVLKNPLSDKIKLAVLDRGSIKLQYKNKNEGPNTSLLFTAVDRKGTTFYPKEFSTSTGNPIEETYKFNLQNIQNPVKIYFNKSLSYLDGKAKIEIPVK